MTSTGVVLLVLQIVKNVLKVAQNIIQVHTCFVSKVQSALCVCVCVCVRKRERESERERDLYRLTVG